jgi:hypothetical protein
MEWYLDLNPNLEPKVNVHEEPYSNLDLEISHEFFYKPIGTSVFFWSKISLFFYPK